MGEPCGPYGFSHIPKKVPLAGLPTATHDFISGTRLYVPIMLKQDLVLQELESGRIRNMREYHQLEMVPSLEDLTHIQAKPNEFWYFFGLRVMANH